MSRDFLNPEPVQAQYRASAPTFVAGTTNPLQQDVNGNLKVNVASSSASNMVVDGTYNMVAPTLANGQVASLQLDSSGNLLVGSTTLATAANQATMHTDLLAVLKAVGLAAATSSNSGGPQPVAATTAVQILAAATRANVTIQNVGAANNLLISSTVANGSNYFCALSPGQSVKLVGAEASTVLSAWSVAGTSYTYTANA